MQTYNERIFCYYCLRELDIFPEEILRYIASFVRFEFYDYVIEMYHTLINADTNIIKFASKQFIEDHIRDMDKYSSDGRIYSYALENEHMTMKMISDNMDKPWDPYAIACCCDITMEFAKSLLKDDTMRENIERFLSLNKFITWDVVNNNRDFPWDKCMLMSNPNITFDIIKNNMDFFGNSMRYFSESKNATLDIIENNPDFPWDYYYVADNPNLTESFLEKHKDKQWRRTAWYSYENISWDFFVKNPTFLRSMRTLSSHKSITLDIIKKNPQVDWDMNVVSQTNNIKIDDVTNNPDFGFDRESLIGGGSIIRDLFINYSDDMEGKWKSSRMEELIGYKFTDNAVQSAIQNEICHRLTQIDDTRPTQKLKWVRMIKNLKLDNN